MDKIFDFLSIKIFDVSTFKNTDVTNYLSIINTVFTVIGIIMGVLTLHFIVFGIVGVFKRKTFPKSEKKLRYGIIIPARNEESVVAGLIESVRKCDYPQDKLDVFVIAHNCTDKTAEVARATGGAYVYEYNNPEECTMGYAFRHLFERVEEDYGISNYDGFFLFNADNILDKQFFEKMNDAFIACDQKCVITSFRNSKNFGHNVMSAMYGLYFAYGCRFEARGRAVLGCSTRVQGTGYVVSSEVVKNGWQYVTLTEDWEFTADQIIQGNKIIYCDEAMFYDEQPTDLHIMWRQRVRWAKGHLLVCVSRLKDLLKSLFTSKKKGGGKHKFSLFDISVNILPVCVISTFTLVLRYILYAFAPLFGAPWYELLLTILREILPGVAFSYLLLVAASCILFFAERKRFPKMSFKVKLGSTLLWPVFLFVSFPAEIYALFKKNVGWKPIPHSDTTDFNEVNKESETDCQEENIQAK